MAKKNLSKQKKMDTRVNFRHDDASDHLLHALYYAGQAAGYAVDHAVER